MQPALSGRSQLSVSLKAYLNNKNRLQPIIGLSSITECVNVGSENRETLYLCEVCACRLTKADIRNHILGSHHRFNYIKAHHPLSVCKWQDSPDLSKLAWPLMELAKTLEVKEGPGDVQLLEVPDVVYQKISTECENNAAALINALKDERGEPGGFSEATSLHYPSESRRIVLCPHRRGGASEVFDGADVEPYEIPARMESPLIPANQTPESTVCFNNAMDVQTPYENNNFSGDVSGSNPLIGLVRVDELRSENGSSYGFLCHCCRIRSNKIDLYDHLTSYSHLSNYLMEIQPDLVDIMNEDTEANFQLLQSLADQVEQQEGRGEPKIVNVPESFCRQITGKSYHWCLRMLSNGWVNTNIQIKRKPVQGVTKHPAFTKIPVVMSKPAKREKQQRKRKKKRTNTMFNVSFPLRKGALLLERTSFRKGSVLQMTSPSLSDPDPVSLPPDTELKCDEASFENNDAEGSSDLQNSQLERGLCEENVVSEGYVPETNIRVTVFQDAEGSDGVHFNQSDKETEDLMVYGERKYERQDGSQGPLQDWPIVNVQAQRGGLFPAASHNEDWRPYKPYYRQEVNPNGWYSSASVQTTAEDMRQMNGNDTTSCSAQHYQNQQMAWGDAGSGTGGTWDQPNLPGEVASFIEAARTNVQTQPVHGGSISSEPGVSFYETNPRQTGTGFRFNWYYADPQNYTTKPAAVQVGYINQMFNCQNTGPSAHPAWYGSEPAGERVYMASMQPNGFTQPGAAVYYSAVSFQKWGPD